MGSLALSPFGFTWCAASGNGISLGTQPSARREGSTGTRSYRSSSLTPTALQASLQHAQPNHHRQRNDESHDKTINLIVRLVALTSEFTSPVQFTTFTPQPWITARKLGVVYVPSS